MATIDIGKIKQVWRGTYASGTAYTPDDVVEYTDSGIVSSYICVANTTGNAPSSSGTAHGSWNYLAKGGVAGTNGTDLTSTLGTQGQIVYRDGSGLAALNPGTSGNVLTTKGSGQNPVWEPAVGGKIGQVVVAHKYDTTSTNSTSFVDISGMSASITPSATSSKILWSYHLNVGSPNHYGAIKIVYGTNSELTTQAIANASGSRQRGTSGSVYDSGTDTGMHVAAQGLDSPNTTSATTYKLRWRDTSGYIYLNRTGNDPDNTETARGISTLTLMEVLA